MQQVCRDGVTPGQVCRLCAVRVGLIEEVVASVGVEQPVRVVDPGISRRVMEFRTVGFPALAYSDYRFSHALLSDLNVRLYASPRRRTRLRFAPAGRQNAWRALG